MATTSRAHTGRGDSIARITKVTERMSGLSGSNTDKGGQTLSRADAGRTRVSGPPVGPRDIQESAGGRGKVSEAGPSAKTSKLAPGAGQRRIVGGEEGKVTGPALKRPRA